MKRSFIVFVIACGLLSCKTSDLTNKYRQEIFQTEKAFEKMALEKGIPEAFYFYADSMAVIKRANDTLIAGKENIRRFYDKPGFRNVTVTWAPDYIEVSKDGTLGYTYGKYSWKINKPDGSTSELKGVFHTVWKRQKDGSWKYVWD